MLTLVESLSLAGDRAKQNDDACGYAHDSAWVIDGATDLHNAPEMGAASDAAWITEALNTSLHEQVRHGDAEPQTRLRDACRYASALAQRDWAARARQDAPRWKLPTASMLIISDPNGQILHGLDLGDCRCFVLDAHGEGHILGGQSSDDEARAAGDALKRTGGGAPLRDAQTLEMLRAKRATHNIEGGAYWVFGVQPECADHARAWTLAPARPAYLLICTDGFSALADRYRAYDAAGLVRAALDKGLQELGRELRGIEAADAAGAKHPRFKQSDDATAVLLRLT